MQLEGWSCGAYTGPGRPRPARLPSTSRLPPGEGHSRDRVTEKGFAEPSLGSRKWAQHPCPAPTLPSLQRGWVCCSHSVSTLGGWNGLGRQWHAKQRELRREVLWPPHTAGLRLNSAPGSPMVAVTHFVQRTTGGGGAFGLLEKVLESSEWWGCELPGVKGLLVLMGLTQAWTLGARTLRAVLCILAQNSAFCIINKTSAS